MIKDRKNNICIIGILLLLWGCGQPANDHFQGYIEGEFLQIAAPLAGQLDILAVKRGLSVKSDELLFSLDHTLESAMVAEAEQGVAQISSQLVDLTKGRRPTEIKAVEARLAQARAARELAQKEFDRLERLVKADTVSREAYDKANSEIKRTNGLVDQLTAELATAGLGGRSDAIDAVRASLQAARERLNQARWKLAQKSQRSPEDGLVFDTFYNPGEFVPAGYPVLSLLPPGRIKIRFFVPETIVATLAVGQQISFSFDGSTKSYRATINYISPKPEFTPPVIYSRETRSKLVFMLEAAPEAAIAAALHPGQPVDVKIEPVQ